MHFNHDIIYFKQIIPTEEEEKMVEKEKEKIEKKEKEEKEIIQEQLNHFYTYVKISLIGIFLNFLIEYIHSSITLYSQRTLHESMVYKFLRAPINLFHDLVPIGQLLNRLTKDIDLIQRIIRGVTNFARALFTITSSFFFCSIIINKKKKTD